MTFDEITSRYTVKSRNGDSVMAVCPCHADKQASLHISRGRDGRTVLYCHAGCNTSDILAAVGLSGTDLFENPAPSGAYGSDWRSYLERREKASIQAVYHYRDTSGAYTFTKVRFNGKKMCIGRVFSDRGGSRLDIHGSFWRYGLEQGQSQKGSYYCADIRAYRQAVEAGQTVFFTEGEKDVNTLYAHGYAAITSGGTTSWDDVLIPLFKGADLVIFADNDEPGIKLAERVKSAVTGVVRAVRVIVPIQDVKGGDISDWWEWDHTDDEFQKLICMDAVEVREVEDEPQPEKNLDQFHMVNDHGRITGVFDYAILQYLKETRDMFILGGVPYIYTDGVFRPDRSGAQLKTMIRELIYPEFIRSTTIKRIYDLFLSDISLQVTMEDLNCYPVEWINFRNGFYDPVNRQMIPHDPKYRAVNQIPHEYDPEGTVQGSIVWDWLKFIGETPEDIDMLCQFAGLCLTRDTRQQKLLILNGEGGTGKSTVIRMIEKMVGAENISNISLNQLTQRFQAIGLLGKLVNSCADLEIDALSDTSVLKKALGEDAFSVEAKGKDQVSMRNYAKMIFSTNQLPVVRSEQTNGFYRRLLILTMNRIPVKKEMDFFDKLAAEITDFIQICVEALERMYKAGRITESSGSIEAVKRLRCDSDTVEAFLSQKVTNDPNGRIKKLDLYQDYAGFCMDMERQSLTKQNFYRSMKTKGYAEVKTGGTEYFRGINYIENLPEISPKSPYGGFFKVTDDKCPFD